MNIKDSNRVTNNPYLAGNSQEINTRTSLGSELKRLLGHPLRFLETLVLVGLTLSLALAGALDLMTTWLYTVSRHVSTDSRPVVSALDCALGQEQARKLCQGVIWASTTSSKRMVLYPWHGVPFLRQYEPYVFIGFFALAVLSFVSIGNPRLKHLGQTFGLVFGFGHRNDKAATTNQRLGLEVNPVSKKKNKDKDKNKEGEIQVKAPWLIPVLELEAEADPAKMAKVWESSLLLGGYMPRLWESDPGYFYLNRRIQPVPYWMTLNMLRTNLVIVAPQGSGKTSSIYRPLLTFMRRSNSVGIFWDSKGDDFNPKFFDYNFDPSDPEHSIKLNIFAGKTPGEAGERLGEALVPDLSGDKQYFSNNAKDAMSALTAAHAVSFGRNPQLVDLLDYLGNPASVQNLHDKMQTMLTGPDQREEGLRLATLLRRVIRLADNKTTDVLGSLAAALSPLVTGPAARVLVTNPDPGTHTIEELLRKPGLIRLSLPVAKSPRIAPILGRLVLAQFTYAVLSPDCNRNIFKMAAVDEARHFITENVANGMAQARSNNAGYVLALQTLSQIREESLLDTIFAVSGTKIVMAGVGEKDARRFSDTFGQLELPYVVHSQGRTTGTTSSNGNSTSRGQEYEFFGGQSGRESRSSRSNSQGKGQTKSQSDSSSTTTRTRPRFFPAELRELQQFQAVVESSDAQGRRWFAQVIDMRASTVNELETQVLKQLNRLGAKSKWARLEAHKRDKWNLDEDWMQAASEGEEDTNPNDPDHSEGLETFVRPVIKFMPVSSVATPVTSPNPVQTASTGNSSANTKEPSHAEVSPVPVVQPQPPLLLPAPAPIPNSNSQGKEKENESLEVEHETFRQTSFLDSKEDGVGLVEIKGNPVSNQAAKREEPELPHPDKNVAGEL